MKNIWARILRAFVQNTKGNYIWLIAPDGKRRSVYSLPNCKFKFRGINNNVYLYEPINDMHLFVDVSNNTNITIHPGGQMNLYIYRGTYGLYGDANLVIEKGFVSTGQVRINLCNGNPIDVTIGRDCLFAGNIDIRTGDYHAIFAKDTGKLLNYDQCVRIGNHVWVASDVFISKGVVISDNSVIGAHSVVTRKFNEGNVIIAGTPAKIVKGNIDWDVRSILDYEKSLK